MVLMSKRLFKMAILVERFKNLSKSFKKVDKFKWKLPYRKFNEKMNQILVLFSKRTELLLRSIQNSQWIKICSSFFVVNWNPKMKRWTSSTLPSPHQGTFVTKTSKWTHFLPPRIQSCSVWFLASTYDMSRICIWNHLENKRNESLSGTFNKAWHS